jgi:hypothetical protein
MNETFVATIVIVVLVYSIPCAFMAGKIRERRGGAFAEGFVLGLVFGVIGVVIAAVI